MIGSARDVGAIVPTVTPGREFIKADTGPFHFEPNEVRAMLFDFDGTVAGTEHLHRATFEAAMQKVLKEELFAWLHPLHQGALQKDLDGLRHTLNAAVADIPINSFAAAWGVPEQETAEHLLRESIKYIKINGVLNEDQNNAVRLFDDLNDKQKHDLIESLTDARAGFFHTFIRGSTLKVHPNGARSLSASDGAPNITRNSPLRAVVVVVEAEMMELLLEAQTAEIPKAIVTSSPKRFVRPLLEKLELEDFFYKRVYATTIRHENDRREVQQLPNLKFKPAPDPWLLALTRLEEKKGVRPGEVLYFENTASAGLSAWKASTHHRGYVFLSCVNPNRILPKLEDKFAAAAAAHQDAVQNHVTRQIAKPLSVEVALSPDGLFMSYSQHLTAGTRPLYVVPDWGRIAIKDNASLSHILAPRLGKLT